MINNHLTKDEKKNQKIVEIGFVLPSLLGCALFIFLPSFFSFLLSFSSWDLLSSIKFVAFNNYIELFQLPEFYLVLTNTIIYAVAVTVFGAIIPFVLASLINSKIRGSNIFKTMYFLPFVTPMIVIAMVWQWIFDPNIGFVNTLFKTNIQWLYDVNLALPVIILISVWKLIGYNMVIFLLGFAGISDGVYEAAKIDGANPVQTFFKITIPMMSPTIFFVVLITTISSFQVFDLIYLMTQGGPNNATNVLVYWLYKNAFELFDIGKASAIAYVLFLFILFLTLIQWKLKNKWVENED